MSNSHRLPYLPQLDGLRAFAILLVLLHHSFGNWPALFPPSLLSRIAQFGWIGVDVFFVLSGFLITRILLQASPSWQALRDFYVKRVLRIWPLYYGLLALTVALYASMHLVYPWRQSVFFVQNFLPYFPKPGFFNQTWSLCVEEHFYLVWPFVMFSVRRQVLPWVLLAVVLVSPLLRLYAIEHGVSDKLLYMSTQFRLDGIALGSLFAVWIGAKSFSAKALTRLGIVLGGGCFLITIALLFPLPQTDFGFHSAWIYSFIALSSCGLLLAAVGAEESSWLVRLLTLRPLRYIGKVSYGLYMIHPFVFSAIHVRIHHWMGPLFSTLFSFLLAALSWRYVEAPLLGWKRHFSHDRVSREKHADARAAVLREPVSSGQIIS